jgi:hypothetical protein
MISAICWDRCKESALLVGSGVASNTLLLPLNKHPELTAGPADALVGSTCLHLLEHASLVADCTSAAARYSAAAGVRVRVQDQAVSCTLAIA